MILRVVFQSVQYRTNYQHCYILVSSAESGMYRYDGNWCIEPKMGLCGTGFTVYRVPVYNPSYFAYSSKSCYDINLKKTYPTVKQLDSFRHFHLHISIYICVCVFVSQLCNNYLLTTSSKSDWKKSSGWCTCCQMALGTFTHLMYLELLKFCEKWFCFTSEP